MDDNIQVCAVYVDGFVSIYGVAPKRSKVRPFLRTLKFTSYGKAVTFALEFEENQRKPKSP
jgi:hypothetical protein